MKQDLIKQFNLPKYVKGKSFAEASKAIDKNFSERKDKASQETKMDLLQRLSEAQEFVKMQEQVAQESANPNPQMGMDQMPMGMNQMFNGGRVPVESVGNVAMQPATDQLLTTPGTPDPVAVTESGGNLPGAAGFVGAAKGVMDLGNMAFGETGIDTSGATKVNPKDIKVGGQAASGAMKGAQAGMAFGPWGAAIGGVVGGAAGLIGGSRMKKEANTALNNYSLAQNSQHDNSYSKGGMVNKFSGGGIPFLNLEMLQDSLKKGIDQNGNRVPTTSVGSPEMVEYQPSVPNIYGTRMPLPSTDEIEHLGFKSFDPKSAMRGHEIGRQPSPFEEPIIDKKRSIFGFAKDNYADLLSYGAIASNLTDRLEKAPNPRRDQLSNRYIENPVDEAQLQNIVQNEYGNVSNAIRGASGGSSGVLRNNLLATSLNKTKALSDAYMQSNGANIADRRAGQEFNSKIDTINLQQSNADEADAQANAGAYESAKAAKRAALFEDIGKIGREESNKELVKELFGYTWNGKYYVDKQGNQHTAADVRAKIKSLKEKKEEEEKKKEAETKKDTDGSN